MKDIPHSWIKLLDIVKMVIDLKLILWSINFQQVCPIQWGENSFSNNGAETTAYTQAKGKS